MNGRPAYPALTLGCAQDRWLRNGAALRSAEMGGLIESAVAYTRDLGWAVFPLKPGRKFPWKGSRAFKDATTDPATVRQWWKRCPRANIGLACGASGLVAIDLDVKNGGLGMETWRELFAKHRLGPTVGSTIASRTPSGGKHLIFRCPPGVEIRNSAGKLGPGVDVRGKGGYIVLPPSILAGRSAAGRYSWQAGVNPSKARPVILPAALAQLLVTQPRRPAPLFFRTPSPAYASSTLQQALQELARAVEGKRNDQLNRTAFLLGHLVGSGCLDRAQVEAELERVALAIGLGDDPGCGLYGIRATVQSGLGAGMRQSWVPGKAGPGAGVNPRSPRRSSRRSIR